MIMKKISNGLNRLTVIGLTALMCLGAYAAPAIEPTPAPAVSVSQATVAKPAVSHPTGSVSPKGAYIYIPDSLQNDVLQLLRGHSRVVDDNLDLDLEEQTTYRGDTIPMVLKQRNLGRYDRGLSALLYVPKGQWSFGLTVSYGNLSTKDLEIFDLLSDINIGAHAFRIRPYLQYTVRNNLAVGMRFGYYNARGNVDSFKVDIDGT